ncbi:MAG: D-glycerate dehydrogenase [Candidatus Verstraetearchaeota archaeon]|nr:D-glycerate dehydrogenase [Candidatus Verstraetearchaeota archaeon]
MEKPRLFISRELFKDIIERLSEHFQVEVWDRYKPPPYKVLLEKVKDADALISLLTDRIDERVLEEAENLRIIAQYAVGFDNINIEAATERGIYVTNTPEVLTESTAELTWALILATARRIVEADIFTRWGEWWRKNTGWHPKMMLGIELKNKILGIIGLGRIGGRVAEIGKAFGMKIIYYDVERKRSLEEKLSIKYRGLEELLREADIISIHTPLTRKTRHLINEEKLKMMKRTAILINTARGAVIDTKALVKALREKWIGGAGLDVHEEEPLTLNHPLTAFKNVVLTPHIGSATYKARHAMAEIAAENLIAFKNGEEPPNLVNREVVKVRKPGFK